MGRINGVNSDYYYDETEKSIVGPEPDGPFPSPLEMKLFICPYNKPSTIEALDGELSHCQGTNSQCPQPGSYNDGHALIHLHQQNGIELITGNNNRIRIERTGNITLDPVGKAIVTGSFEVHKADGSKVFFKVTDTNVTLESNGGAQIILQSDGSIDLKPASGKKVTVFGNLKVNGTIE